MKTTTRPLFCAVLGVTFIFFGGGTAFPSTNILLEEGFDSFKDSKGEWNSNRGSIDGSISELLPGWSCSKARQVPSAVNYGTTSDFGYMLTPAITRVGTGPVNVYFESVWIDNTGITTNRAVVQVLDPDTGSVVLAGDGSEMSYALDICEFSAAGFTDTYADLSTQPVELTLPEAPAVFQLKFTCEKKGRIILDTVRVSETVSDTAVQLEAPAGLRLVGQPGIDSLTVSWNAVDSASGYRIDAEMYAGQDSSGADLWVRIPGAPFEVNAPVTEFTAGGLADDAGYRFCVMSVGDGEVYVSSEYSGYFDARTSVDQEKPVFSCEPAESELVFDEGGTAEFTVSAMSGGSAAVVEYLEGMPGGTANAFSFSGGVFSWSPDIGEAGTYSVVFYVDGSQKRYTYTVTFTVVSAAPPEIVGLCLTNASYNAFSANWEERGGAAQYIYDVWTGSSVPGSSVHMETFPEYSPQYYDGNTDLTPVAGTLIKARGIYSSDTDENGDRIIEIKFGNSSPDTGNDYFRTLVYPAPVVRFGFRVKGRSTGGLSELKVKASADGSEWTDVYSLVGDAIPTSKGEGFDRSLEFSASLGYRVFMFEFVKDSGNVGIGNIFAEYDGCGARSVPGYSDSATAEKSVVLGDLRPETLYYVRVKPVNALGVEGSYACARIYTLEAPATTVVIIR